ncbi:MAG: alpha/beta fold hydrolase [Micropepsaceae bacterium]
MMRRLRFAALAFATLVVLLASAANAAPSPQFRLTSELCPDSANLTAQERKRVRCGYLRVPETYAKPNGRTIELAVSVVEPKSGKPFDSVVMLHGGPGGGEMQNYRYRLNEPLGARTIVMFDQRGVGRSRPALCPELGDAIFQASVKGLSADAETGELVVAHNRCRDRLVAQKIDLTSYNTDATVADMESLRTALGFDRWKVYGVSYGTAVALAYLRDHADRLNALVLDSVYPLDAPPASNGVANMMRSLKELSAACAAQAACKSRFGNLEHLFFKAVRQLAQEPLEVPAIGATAKLSEAVKISAPAFMTVIHQMLYDKGAYEALPYLIERVAARDGEVFALLVDEFQGRANAITHGQYAAVECYERFPFDSRDAYEFASSAWPLARDNMTLLTRHFDICAAWTDRAAKPMEMPERTTVPTLVLAGGWDPITPPAYSKAAAERIGARYVELPFHGHGVRGDKTCGAPMLRTFLDKPNLAPDSSCTRHRSPPVFVTSLVRAPSIARELSSIASGLEFMTAPIVSSMLALLAFLLISVKIWAIVAIVRVVRTGTSAVAGFWTRPGTPLGLAATAVVATPVAATATLAASAASMSPVLLMIGLPISSIVVFALPWAAIACLAWGTLTLVTGTDRAERPTVYSIHLWLVVAAAATVLALFIPFGLLLPEII